MRPASKMEVRNSFETSIFRDEVCDDKTVPSIRIISINEHQPLNEVERSTRISQAVIKNSENNGAGQTVSLLSQYYEGAPLFYSNEPRKAKVFTPVLLYHSYSNDDCNSCDNNLQNFCESESNLLALDDSRNRHLNTTLSEKEIHGLTKPSMLETDERIQKDILQKGDSNSRRNISNVVNKTHNTAESISCAVQSKDTLVKSEPIHGPIFSVNETLQHGCRRSAFSKPRRSQDIHHSHILNTYVDSSVKLSQPAHNSTDVCGFAGFPFVYPFYFNTDDYQNVNIQSSTRTSYPNLLPSRRSESCMCEHCLRDISNHQLYSEHNTRQLPNCSYTYNSNHYQFVQLNPLLLCNQMVNAQFNIPVVRKQGKCLCDAQQFWEAGRSSEALPKGAQKVAPEKAHKCDCGRTFARNEELTRHRRIHSGQRPFRCSLCAKTFGRKDHLKKHRTTHLHISEKKVHVCNIKDCQQRYTRSDALARHQWAIHGIKASIPK
ncbi:hypothetical protein BsWGS_01449 [Bradybaena similaris]